MIKYLSSYYANFKFDLYDDENGEMKPSHQLEVWYDVFKDFDEDELVSMVKQFCRENIFAPQSPTQLLEYMRNKLFTTHNDSELAWEKVIETYRDYGYYNFEKGVKLLNNAIIQRSYEMMKSSFRDLTSDKIPFVRKEFIEIYERNLKQNINKNISQNVIGIENKLLLEEKK